jgi:hypothetical protein
VELRLSEMSAVRRAALGSSALGAIQLLLFCTSLPAALHDWTELAIAALGLLLVGASVAVIGKVRWARRALVLILWLTAPFSAWELAVLLVLA